MKKFEVGQTVVANDYAIKHNYAGISLDKKYVIFYVWSDNTVSVKNDFRDVRRVPNICFENYEDSFAKEVVKNIKTKQELSDLCKKMWEVFKPDNKHFTAVKEGVYFKYLEYNTLYKVVYDPETNRWGALTPTGKIGCLHDKHWRQYDNMLNFLNKYCKLSYL